MIFNTQIIVCLFIASIQSVESFARVFRVYHVFVFHFNNTLCKYSRKSYNSFVWDYFKQV